MKICSMCKESKSVETFSKNKARKDGLQSMCKPCWNSYYKEHYYKTGKEKERLLKKNAEKKATAREFLRSAKAVPCMDCGVQYPYYVMDFDHRDPTQKSFSVAQMVSTYSVEKIVEEIAKCDVVCANCHRERTYSLVV